MIDANEIELNGKVYVAEETDPDNDCSGCVFRCIPACCAGIMCYSEDRVDGRTVIFVEKEKDSVSEIIPADKVVKEDKSATVAATNNTRTESLDSLFNQIVLLQKENDSLVEQKEQIISKISANTQAINILKDKMQGRLNQVGIVSVGDDKANVVEEGEILDITDWQDSKVGDMVEITSVHKGTFSSGYEMFIGTVATVLSVDDIKYQNLEVLALNTRLWIDGFEFISRPNR